MDASDLDYAYLRDLVQTESSNLIDPARNALFDTRLAPMARLVGASSLHDFVTLLQADRPAHLHRAVTEAMVVSETSFFRDPRLFEALSNTILPHLVHLRRPAERLRIWSAACSTGQEAFSVAILLNRLFPELSEWDVKIVGTDISRPAIDYARRGRFRPSEIQRGLSAQILSQHFTPEGGEWVIHPSIASVCDFRHANLCVPMPHLPHFDLILLRNVLLYFAPADRTGVLEKMHSHLSREGYLILGDSEQAEDSTDLFEAQIVNETYVYRTVQRP